MNKKHTDAKKQDFLKESDYYKYLKNLRSWRRREVKSDDKKI